MGVKHGSSTFTSDLDVEDRTLIDHSSFNWHFDDAPSAWAFDWVTPKSRVEGNPRALGRDQKELELFLSIQDFIWKSTQNEPFRVEHKMVAIQDFSEKYFHFSFWPNQSVSEKTG